MHRIKKIRQIEEVALDEEQQQQQQQMRKDILTILIKNQCNNDILKKYWSDMAFFFSFRFTG